MRTPSSWAPVLVGALLLAANTSALAFGSSQQQQQQQQRVASGIELSSGLKLTFRASHESAYCLITDPCLHVNGLLGASNGAAWVRAVGIRTRDHSLELSAHVAPSSGEAALSRVVLDGADVADSLVAGETIHSDDATLSVETVKAAHPAPLFLVTLSRCSVRLLLRLESTALSPLVSEPHFVVSALDWSNLDSPHGVLGQMFPNHALAGPFPGAGGSPAAPGSLSGRVQAALDRLRALVTRSSPVPGVPAEYLSSSLTAADCAVARFHHPTTEAASAHATGDGGDGSGSASSAPHAATGKGGSAVAGSGTRLGRKAGQLSVAELKLIESTQGTSETGPETQEATASIRGLRDELEGPSAMVRTHSARVGRDQEASGKKVQVSRADLQVIEEMQGTAGGQLLRSATLRAASKPGREEAEEEVHHEDLVAIGHTLL